MGECEALCDIACKKGYTNKSWFDFEVDFWLCVPAQQPSVSFTLSDIPTLQRDAIHLLTSNSSSEKNKVLHPQIPYPRQRKWFVVKLLQ